MVITSIKPNSEFLAGPFALPIAPTLEPYVKVWRGTSIRRAHGQQPALRHDRIGTGGSAGFVPAFALSRFEPPASDHLRVAADGADAAAADRADPALRHAALAAPLRHPIGLIIVHGVYGMPAQILILRGFMTAIPRDIEKAAQIEGASDFQIFWKVILPLAVPGIIVGYTLNFIAIWKEFVFALVFLNHEANFPVTVGMLKLNSDRYMSVFNLPAAGLVISQIPIVILFILAIAISSGNFVGAVKG